MKKLYKMHFKQKLSFTNDVFYILLKAIYF